MTAGNGQEAREHGRTLMSFMSAPLIPAVIAGCVYLVKGTYDAQDVQDALLISIFVCLAFYALQAIIGIPAYLFLSRKKLHRAWIYPLLGAFGAALPASLVWRHAGWDLHPAVLYYPAVLGAGTGLMFWMLARPDKRANASPNSN
jgi:hypothetical protein